MDNHVASSIIRGRPFGDVGAFIETGLECSC
jgi:hypothetical protein